MPTTTTTVVAAAASGWESSDTITLVAILAGAAISVFAVWLTGHLQRQLREDESTRERAERRRDELRSAAAAFIGAAMDYRSGVIWFHTLIRNRRAVMSMPHEELMKSDQFLRDEEVKAAERLSRLRVALAAFELVAPTALAEAAVEWVRRLGDLGLTENPTDVDAANVPWHTRQEREADASNRFRLQARQELGTDPEAANAPLRPGQA